MTPERPVEYTDENPIDIDSARFDSLISLIAQRCIDATSDLGEFGVGMGCHTDGSISISFGPNMLVRWDVIAALPAPKIAIPHG